MMDLFSGIVGTLASIGMERWSRSKEARFLQAALRDRLHREVKLNLEIGKLLAGKTNTEATLADLLSTAAFEEVCALNLPLGAVLGQGSLPAPVQRYLQQADLAEPNGNYVRWAADIATEIDLIERIWHRMRVLKARQALNGSLGDLGYLMHLHRTLDMHWRTQDATH